MRTKTASAKAKTSPKATSTRVATKKPAPIARKAPTKRSAKAVAPAPTADAGGSKQSRLITLLRGEPGATLAQMTQLTGWQPHTVRATISSVLRKKLGLNVSCAPGASGERLYRIVA